MRGEVDISLNPILHWVWPIVQWLIPQEIEEAIADRRLISCKRLKIRLSQLQSSLVCLILHHPSILANHWNHLFMQEYNFVFSCQLFWSKSWRRMILLSCYYDACWPRINYAYFRVRHLSNSQKKLGKECVLDAHQNFQNSSKIFKIFQKFQYFQNFQNFQKFKIFKIFKMFKIFKSLNFLIKISKFPKF